jgi:uncharacterized protein
MRGLLSGAGLLAAILLPGVAGAYYSPGSPTGYVNDFARVLSAGEVSSLNAELSAFEASTSNQIAVVTIPSMQGDYIENFAVKLFEEWGIGKKDKDNGVLLLLSVEERKLRIEVGYGLEGSLPDSLAQRIINDDIVPELKAGDYDAAVEAGARSIMAATQGEYEGGGNPLGGMDAGSFLTLFIFLPLVVFTWLAAILARSKSWWAGGAIGTLAGLGIGSYFAAGVLITAASGLGLGFLGLIFDYIVSNAYTGAKLSSGKIPWWAGGGGFGGGHSSGGGFGGFGGGSSGGGGASGGW